MRKILAALIVAASLAAGILFTGCKTHEGSREFIPGQGWRQN